MGWPVQCGGRIFRGAGAVPGYLMSRGALTGRGELGEVFQQTARAGSGHLET